MSGPLERPKPLAEQIHDRLSAGISAGEYPDGALLPSVTDLAAEYRVSRSTAHRALGWLETDGVAESTGRGYVARPGRTVAGPQQRLTWTRFPASERVEVLNAGLVDAPAYVRPLLGLQPVRMDGLTPVIRREQIHYDHAGVPFMLSVEWYPPQFGDPVPELMQAAPIGDPGGAVRLIEQRTGRRVVRGRQAREARHIRDDGREGPHLNLVSGAAVLAEVWMWFDPAETLVYGEYVLQAGRVTENEYAA
jgi:DNA-binding GntR family transcriptional regulator